MKKKNTLVVLSSSVLFAISLTINYFLTEYISQWMSILIYVALSIVYLVQLIAVKKNKESLLKSCIVLYIIAIVFMLIFGAIFWSGIYLEFYNEEGKIVPEKVAEVIGAQKGSKFIYILLAFLQVTFVPISSSIVTMAGVILFGPGEGFLYSLIGQLLGSIFAFYLGRLFGERFVVWIVGREAFNKYRDLIKGRDKIMLSFMFLFPFFPDDLLCMFAGLTTFTGLTFTLMVACTRSIAIGVTTLGVELVDEILSLGAWAYLIFALIILVVIGMFILVWKQGDKFEYKLLSFIDRILPKRFRKAFVSDEALDVFSGKESEYQKKPKEKKVDKKSKEETSTISKTQEENSTVDVIEEKKENKTEDKTTDK